MAWIRTVDSGEADEELRAALEKVRSARGAVANIVAVHSLKPSTMLAHVALYLDLMFGRSDLSRAEREALAVAVSSQRVPLLNPPSRRVAPSAHAR